MRMFPPQTLLQLMHRGVPQLKRQHLYHLGLPSFRQSCRPDYLHCYLNENQLSHHRRFLQTIQSTVQPRLQHISFHPSHRPRLRRLFHRKPRHPSRVNHRLSFLSLLLPSHRHLRHPNPRVHPVPPRKILHSVHQGPHPELLPSIRLSLQYLQPCLQHSVHLV